MRAAVGGGLLAAIIVLVLASCGPVPQPFRTEGPTRLDNPLLTVPGGEGVFVATVEGPEGWIGQALATAMSTALRRHGVVAGARWANRNALELRGVGYQQLHHDRPGELVMLWSLVRHDGTVLREFETRDTPPAAFWSEPTAPVFRAVSDRIARQVVAWIRADGRPPLRLAFVPRAGTPDARGSALAREMSRSLAGTGLVVVAGAGNADLLVWPRVTAAALEGGTTEVAIAWMVRDRSGTSIGRIDQQDVLDAGTVANRWDGVAGEIARAATDALAGLVRSWRAAVPGRPGGS